MRLNGKWLQLIVNLSVSSSTLRLLLNDGVRGSLCFTAHFFAQFSLKERNRRLIDCEILLATEGKIIWS